MNDLENLNRPVIGCLMQDISLSLNSAQLEMVARWALKTAMIQDAIDTRNRATFYSKTECEQLRQTSSVAPVTRVWLGRFAFRSLLAQGTDIGIDIHDSPIAKTANGCINTLVVGHLAIQVCTLRVPAKYAGNTIEITTKGGPWDDLLVPIWPITRFVRWPPPLTFTNEGALSIARLHDRFMIGKAV